ncbi:uncharacterized protein LOC141904230 [Tubulanus polymorphus]|uniref:uncharacterized protein LOC141904230 n=1 Tax=Tubulanus polymorphus TaxID=672921 RepID=UPI003DA6A6D4
MKSGLMYQQYSETNGSSSGQPSPNMNFPAQQNGMDNMGTDGAMYRPQGCYPSMYQNSYMGGQSQYPGYGYPPAPANHIYPRHDGMYSGSMYNQPSDQLHHDPIQQPGYFRSLMASPLPPSPIHNSGAPTPPPTMRPPFVYPNSAPLPSNRASPISPMMIRSPASVHSNQSVPCSSPGPVPSPNLKSPKSAAMKSSPTGANSTLKSTSGPCTVASQKSMMSPPNSSQIPHTTNDHTSSSKSAANNNPLQSLERLSKLPNKQVVDPKSVVKTQNGTKMCADGRHCSTDSEAGSRSGSINTERISIDSNSSVKLIELPVKQEIHELSPSKDDASEKTRRSSEHSDNVYDNVDGATDTGDITPSKKKRGRPFGSKTVNRTPRVVLAARKLQKHVGGDDDVVRKASIPAGTETKKKMANESEQKPLGVKMKKEKSLNPIVRVNGSRKTPTSCSIINNTQQNIEEDKKKRKIIHNYNAQVEDDRTIAALAAGTMVTPSAWVCCFCGRGSTFDRLGDLFGPYYIENYKQSSPRKRLKSTSPSGVRDNDLEVWVHEECIAWAHGVYIVGGRIQGLGEAAKVASQTVCSGCKTYGATIGCLQKNCNQKYHYLCAQDRDCQLMEENFSLFCTKHKDKKGIHSTSAV